MPFSLEGIKRALSEIKRIPEALRPGGYITLPSLKFPRESLLASLSGLEELTHRLRGEPEFWKVKPTYEVVSRYQFAEPQPGATGAGVGFTKLEKGSKTVGVSPPTTGGFTPLPGGFTPLPKAEITTAKPAPTPTPTPPPPTPPPVAGGAGAPTPPATAPGFTAPTLSSLPPAPVQISERAFTGIPAPRPEIPVGQFEAMIRALAELTGGRYIPRPLMGAEPFGPTGALERALRRLRERELGLPTT